jgi:hypothetical protein
MAQRLIKDGINAVGVWDLVEPFMNVGPESRCEHCCGWGHIESKCSGNLASGYCSGPHRTSTYKCDVVRCSAKQVSPCAHTPEKCPNCKGNYIAFSSRCTKKAEATREEQERRRREPAGQTTKTVGPRLQANKIALGLSTRALGGGAGGTCKEVMADAEVGGAEAEDVTMVESTMPMRTAMLAPASKVTATAAGGGIEPKSGMAVAATPNVQCDPTQLRQVLRMGHGNAEDSGGTEGRCGVSPSATKRQSRKRNQPLGIRHLEMEEGVDGSAHGEQSSNE